MLQVTDLSFAYKNRPIVDGLSFAVKSGELLQIAGPNGAGKSTLMNLLTGLMSGYKGTIKYNSHDDFRSWTSWIAPDANGLAHSLSAVDNLRFWLNIRGAQSDAQKICEILEFWGLKGHWVQSELPVSKFSTGMRRRLALARLDLENSKLWLLDEPLFGLDDKACQQFKSKLKQHVERGHAALIVTHDERLLDGLPHQKIQLGGIPT
jgi:heme exporter protein A